MAQPRPNKRWRWGSEDPQNIIPLILILVAILLVPWDGCNPLKADKDDTKPVAGSTP